MMVSGGAGTGKTTLAAHMAARACAQGERVLFMSLEESPKQLVRNMASIGLDLQRWVDDGLLRLWSERPTASGLEEHLAMVYRLIDEAKPSLFVLDAVASLGGLGPEREISSVVARDLHVVKSHGITGLVTTLNHTSGTESSEVQVSSLVDTWLLLRNTERDDERTRLLSVIKSRGSAHSNRVREFLITDTGAKLVDVYRGPDGILTGSARVAMMSDDGSRGEGDDRRDQGHG